MFIANGGDLEDGTALDVLRDQQANEAEHGCAAEHHLRVGREGGDAERPVLATLPRGALQPITRNSQNPTGGVSTGCCAETTQRHG